MKEYLVTIVEPDNFILSLGPRQIDYLFSKINWQLFCNIRIEYIKIREEYERKEKEKNQGLFDDGGGII